jgi:2-polyprenyl-6-methoxyphenol hydroxylase-like FAD-dependent oxidoreductase
MMKGMVVIADSTPLTLFIEVMRFPQPPNWPTHSMPQPADYVYWVLGSRKSNFGLTDTELLALSVRLTSHWSPAFTSVLAQQDPSQSSVLRIASVLPTMRAWKPSERITLIGDAVHVMPPTGGVGANIALRDAANLANILAEEGVSVASIGKYEEEMREYAS